SLAAAGPPPPAVMRPGPPAQRRAAAAASAASGSRGSRAANPREAAQGASARAPRGSGDAAEFVAGRNPVVESLRAAVPAAVLYVGARVQHDERISEAIKLAAGRGVAVLEAGQAELDRLTGGALRPGPALPAPPAAHP